MQNNRRPFPLIADDEPVIVPDRQMQLYENEDLITHIRGNYSDKVYQESTQPPVPKPAMRRGSFYTRQSQPVPQQRETSKAREEARKDIKQKRQVFVEKEPMSTGLMSKARLKPSVKPATNALSQASKVLEQDEYILAELPKVYNQPNNTANKQVRKNSYDFLKKSQIYNKQEYQSQRERRVAQELNLTRFED